MSVAKTGELAELTGVFECRHGREHSLLITSLLFASINTVVVSAVFSGGEGASKDAGDVDTEVVTEVFVVEG